jgi:hypothetical protein
MKHFSRAAVLALSLLAVGSTARANWPTPFPYKVEAGANAYFRVTRYPYGQPQQLGPWYLYWPMEAHFYPQAPAAYPGYPHAMSLPPNFYPPRPGPYPANPQQPHPGH